MVAAHLEHTKRLGVELPERFALAQNCRPKLTDITGGVTRPVEVPADPVRVLKETMESETPRKLKARRRDLPGSPMTYGPGVSME